MLPPTAGAVHTSGPAERELVTTSHAHYNRCGSTTSTTRTRNFGTCCTTTR